jgi:hypothetical protein
MASTAIFILCLSHPKHSFFLFYLDDLPAFVSPAMRTDVVREERFMTLGTKGIMGGIQFVMSPPLIPSGR